MRGEERERWIARPDTRLGSRNGFRDLGRRAALLLVIGVTTLACVPHADARNVKLWPFFEYQSDAEAGTRSVKLLGPLIEYRTDPDYLTLALRPLLSIRQARVGHDDEVRILYPLITSRWRQTEQTTVGAAGLVRYRTTTTADGRTLTRQQFRAAPIYFYDWKAEGGASVSLAPFYADVEDFLGYERVEMIAFPLYLHLYDAPVDRRFALFPFFETVNQAEGSVVRFWPFYGRRTVGDIYDSGFYLWPFYVWDERTDDDGTVERLFSFPFYARVRAPARETTAYGTIAYVHTLDRGAAEERWGFPWPLWAYTRSTTSDEGSMLRLFPFYARERSVAAGNHRPGFGDSLPMVYRDEERPVGRGRYSQVRALFPLYRTEQDNVTEDGSTLALLDGMLPRDAGFRDVYGPLWEMYAWEGPRGARSWSAAWGAVTHTGGTTTYPWRFE